MAATSVGLIYSIATGRLRWFVVPDQDSDLSRVKVKAGEALFVVSRAQYLTAGSGPNGLQALINAHTGVSPSNDRYAIVDAGGNVVYAVIADPTIDPTPSPSHSFVRHATAMPGALYLGGVVVQRSPLIDQIVITRERAAALRR